MKKLRTKWKAGKPLSPILTAGVLFLFLPLISVTCVAIQPGSLSGTLQVFFSDLPLLLLNGFPVGVLLLLFWSIFGNPFHSAGATGLIIHLLSYVNLIKTECRGDPFVPDDVLLLQEATDAAGSYGLDLHIGLLLAILGFSALCFLAGSYFRCPRPKWFLRVLCGIAVTAAFVLSMMTVYPDKDVYARRADSMDKSNVPRVFENCGFLYCFLHNYRLYEVEMPDGYSASVVEKWAAQASEFAPPDTMPNVIFIMCEAYSDLSEDQAFLYTEENDPMAGFKEVAGSDRAHSGHIVVSNFGAGTANTEFDILTGIQTNMLAEGTTSAFRTVHRKLNALPHVFSKAGYSTYFMHPGKSWFYNRDSVYDFLGMSERVFQDAFDESDYKGIYISDAAFLDQLKEDLSLRIAGDAPVFAYGVTIQNHQAYPYYKYGFEPPDAPVNATLDYAQRETLAVYMEGIRDSSRMLKELAAYLDTLDEPTVLIFFGDHLPALLPDYGVYKALGMDIGETDTVEQVLDTYKTPYVIYSNEACGDLYDYNTLDLPDTLSSNYLGAAIYELIGLKGADPYFDYLTEVRRELPVISHGCYVTGDGTLTRSLNEAQEEILTRLDFWKYYRMKDEPLRK